MYGFYHPLEARLFALHGWSSVGLALEARKKVPLLEADLIHAGMTETTLLSLPICQTLPRVETFAQGLGCLYVVEGATLGGQVLTRHFQRQTHTQQWSCSFFRSYRDRTGPMWKEFVEKVTSYATTTATEESILSSAMETFLCLEQWL